VPGNLAADSPSGQEVDLSWTPSTDEVGVVGYDVYRNGSPLASTGPVSSYVDTSVVQGATYTYTVKAFDAVGNVSGASNGLKVKVP
jgi:hypothetical protein